MEFDDGAASEIGIDLVGEHALARGRVGQSLQQNRSHRLDRLGIPRDSRGIVLACGFAGAAAFGVGALISPGDPIGYAFIAGALVGYFFLQTRGLPALVWLLIAAYGAAGGIAGAPADWVECGIGLLLAGIALLPPHSQQDQPDAPIAAHLEPPAPLSVTAPPDSRAGNGSVPNGHNKPSLEHAAEVGASSAGGGLVLRCLGEFRIQRAERDLTPSLDDKPVLAFLFRLLLASYAVGQPKLARTAIGDELSPGYPLSNQRERVRKQVWDLTHDLGPELRSLIRSSRSHVWLDLDGVDCDLLVLRRLSDEVRQAGSLISSALATQISDFLKERRIGDFLPGFEELERQITQGRGTAGDTVRSARLAIANQEADLIGALTEYEDTLGRPGSTIPHLRAAMDALPDRQDIARLLATAYLKTGQTARAHEVRTQFALAKE